MKCAYCGRTIHLDYTLGGWYDDSGDYGCEVQTPLLGRLSMHTPFKK